MLSNIDKYKVINFNLSKENLVIENTEIKNQNSMPINNNFSPFSSKMPDINRIIKSFNIFADEDSESNISSSDLRLCENYGNKNEMMVQSKENKYKNEKTSDKFEVIRISQEKDKKIFSIKKTMKLGRIKKNSNKIGKHSKYRRDNIIRRFKVRLMNNIYEYINKSFIINSNNNTNKKHLYLLKRLSSYNVKLMSKRDNIIWLNSSVKYIFSQKISSKISSFNSHYNKKIINKIYEEKTELKVIDILNKAVREMWGIYINDNDESYTSFTKLKDDIIKLKNIGETEYYIALYIQIAKKFEEIINKIIPRK